MDAKCVVFAFCVIFFSLTDAHHHMTKNFKDIIKKCVESTGVDESKFSGKEGKFFFFLLGMKIFFDGFFQV